MLFGISDVRRMRMPRLAEMTTGLITSNISQLVGSRFLKCNLKTYPKIHIGSVCQWMGKIYVTNVIH